MDPLFRLAAHPQIYFSRMWRFPEYGSWLDVKEIALTAYLCLNMFYVKAELWDDYSRRKKLEDMKRRNQPSPPEEMFDYRLTSSYQHMLVESTGSGRWNYDCAKHPHREFFGVPRGMYTSDLAWAKRHKFGYVTPSDLANTMFKGTHVPSKTDVSSVLILLGKRGLPAELALQVLDFADYRPYGRLPIRDDPLHPDNSEELAKYLRYC
ncbi:hypothetical protein BDV96DRAFT_644923 [Lophiotrema nucula]|uniref:Uncharacterized protein n=1 Tax=Lophiotrema nucula TaxID=690887 RepID=A0A6A5ZDQ3_9PLEO|nr:hypothetical protein BDV96DRAFT_644923 [Lophiotrema nucula]